VDARDPVGYGSARIPCGRETELDFAAGSMCHAGGDSRVAGSEIRWTASAGRVLARWPGDARNVG